MIILIFLLGYIFSNGFDEWTVIEYQPKVFRRSDFLSTRRNEKSSKICLSQSDLFLVFRGLIGRRKYIPES